jgi:iduronate 2-sulfatase
MTLTTRRTFLRTSLFGAACAAVSSRGFAQTQGKYNVLFIVVDDLRPLLGCYGFPQMKTPNIDQLAADGFLFKRAYCQQALCNPSRTSMMTGLRPDTTKIYDLQTHFRLNVPDAITLPQYFKKQGYYTQALSQVFHAGLDDPDSWSVPHWAPRLPPYASQEILAKMETEKQEKTAQNEGPATDILERDPRTGQPLKLSQPKYCIQGPSWESAEIADNQLPDGETAQQAVELLRALKDQRFFMAVGFQKPHLPFVAPKSYFDLYPLESISLAENSLTPKNAPDLALHNYDELRSYEDIPKDGPLTDHKAKELIRAYYSSISYVDAQIGLIVAELDRCGLRQNTLIVLCGDHGWHLGEQSLWGKESNFESATRIPLIVCAPGMSSKGIQIVQLVESVDIYPTLCELAGLPLPEGLEGVSLVPLISVPGRPWKKAAFSQCPRGQDVMGYTLRVDRYRYTEWIRNGGGELAAVEFYDHITDPGEKENTAASPDNRDKIGELEKILREGWRASMPPGMTIKDK